MQAYFKRKDMRKISNPHIAQLQMQLRFTSPAKRKEFLKATEGLLDIVRPDQQYPFEFICFKITGYNPKGLPKELIDGQTLIDDLQLFLLKLSAQVTDKLEEHDDEILTIDQAAQKLNISIRTISRWRRRGLIARKFTFPDGLKKLALTSSALAKFVEANPDLANQAASFKRISKEETQKIIDTAIDLGTNHGYSRQRAIEKIAKDFKRSNEAIRITIKDFQLKNPRKKFFSNFIKPLDPHQVAEVYKMYTQGVDAPQIAKKFKRSRGTIYRIIRRKRAKELLKFNTDYIANPEFVAEDAEIKILGRTLAKMNKPSTVKNNLDPSSSSLSKYLSNVKSLPRLTRNREVQLFKKYNFLKYQADELKKQLHSPNISGRIVSMLDKCILHIEQIKYNIIEANLHLVVSIAGKHSTSGTNLQDLISEGNYALMRAVDGFDYSRGFRFATYASWIIAKDFARNVPADRMRKDRAGGDSLENIQRDLRVVEAVDFGAIERARHSLVQVIKEELSDREQYVILNHYGLLGTGVRKETKTLQQIGKALNLTGERIRQIELTALQKLKQSLTIDEFELLTG